ncbi:GNAT family N-acetyltransferase [Pseudomonas sp. PH1b]|uniref:GNAT family N-acetyltransferase n=1 Tax=Pseudomonas sp. PH1b TaxID=1397282 RepID=UPI00046A580B|nr:GNAT family N-acetyltransferase [Pseudomonas sp. PH1b]
MQHRDAQAIEFAEQQYLRSRVAGLAALPGNPYRALLSGSDHCGAFVLGASNSPMLNRVQGDGVQDGAALAALLGQYAEYSPVVALIGASTKAPDTLELAGQPLCKLRGWTHVQMTASLDSLPGSVVPGEIELVTAATLGDFARLHGEGFAKNHEARQLNQAAFGALLEDSRAALYLLREQGVAVAGAALFAASNGVAYLGTAFTSKAARGRGYHRLLIAQRIHQARAWGCQQVAATALASSQSRRNLQHCGLQLSHAQSLYRLAAVP